jgi:hypothetical protein
MPRRWTLIVALPFVALLQFPGSASAVPRCPSPQWITTTPSAGLVARVWASSCDVKARPSGALRLNLRSRSAAVKLRYRVNATTDVRLVRFPANRVVLTQRGTTVDVLVRGRKAEALRWSGRDWTTLAAQLDRARLVVRLDGHRVRIALRRQRRESRVELGSVTRPISAPGTPAASSPAGTPAPAAPAPNVPAIPGVGAPSQLFAPGSVWNARFDGRLALNPQSDALVAELKRSVTVRNPWINTTSYSVPLYRVGPNQPTVRVQLNTSWRMLQTQWDAVPLPDNALPANGTDGHLVVYQASSDTLWEFYKLARSGTQWSARWGGRIVGVSRSPGYYYGAERTHGATATSLSLAGGLITIDELRAGRIDHALAMAIPYGRRGVVTWPAQRGDGYVASDTAIPEGTRFRLDPSFDVTTVKGPPLMRMMAEAAQRYGMLVRDQSAGVTFYGEDPRQFGMNPFAGPTGFFQGQFANNMLRRYFPWAHLQVVAATPLASAARRRAKVHPK